MSEERILGVSIASHPGADSSERVRCAEWTRAQEADPIGTAPSTERFVLVDWPLPWPSRVEDVEALEPLLGAASRTRTRVQLIVPRPASETREVVLHDRSKTAGFSGFERRAVEASPGDLVAVACGLLADPAAAEPTPGDTDLLICSHGSRDACCGSAGTALAVALASAAPGVDDTVHVRRTSHTGGHRFAPTALFLPSGTVWAYADEDLVERVLGQIGDVRDLLDRYRGSAALESPAQQAVERMVFAEVGWAWLDWSRTVEDRPDGSVRVTGMAPDGVRRCWEGTVERGRILPVPDCRRPIADATKSSSEVRVASLDQVDLSD